MARQVNIQQLMKFLGVIRRHLRVRKYINSLISRRVFNVKPITECFPGSVITKYKLQSYDVETPEAVVMPFQEAASYLQKPVYPLPQFYSIRLSNAYLWTDYNVLINEVNDIAAESSSSIRDKEYFRCVPLWLSKRENYSGTCTLLRSVSNRFYHALIDNLPRLYILCQPEYTKLNRIDLLVEGELSPVEQYYLPKLCPENVRIVKVKKGRRYKLEDLIFTSFLSQRGSGYLPAEYIEYFHKCTTPNRNRVKKNRIFISRDKSRMRRITNEDSLFEVLKVYGFVKYFLEDLTFDEQLELFFDAEAVVSPHGAGLTNIIHSNEIPVVEMFPSQSIKPNYYFLCKSIGGKYNYTCSNKNWVHDDFDVNIEQIKRIVGEMRLP